MPDQYPFDVKTGEALDPVPLRFGQLDGEPLVRRNATLEAPPQPLPTGHVAVRVGGQAGAWETKEDLRGTVYWDAQGNEKIHDKLGPLPAGAITGQKPVTVNDIKSRASELILAIMDRNQQNNSMAEGLEMVMAFGHDQATWPADAQARAGADLAKWAVIKQIRAHSNNLETLLANGELPESWHNKSNWPQLTS